MVAITISHVRRSYIVAIDAAMYECTNEAADQLDPFPPVEPEEHQGRRQMQAHDERQVGAFRGCFLFDEQRPVAADQDGMSTV